MPENFIIKYRYNNEKMSKAACGHIFRYLSALSDYKFVDDNDAPVVWRGDRGDVPESARIILEGESNADGSSDFEGHSENRRAVVVADPIERIFKKIAVKTAFGPYSKNSHRPVNDPEESLGGIVMGFFRQLQNVGIPELSEHNISLWPGGHGFALAVTHDVDIIRRSVRGSVRLLFRRDVPGSLKGLSDSIGSLLGLCPNPYGKIGEWIEKEKKQGIKSTFFVFPGNRMNKNDPKYRADRIKDSLDCINRNRFGLALHSGIECHRGEDLELSRQLLNRAGEFAVTGIRPHYLSASLPEYWRKAAELGFRYSSCLGFDEDVGFYQGIDLPFKPYDAQNDTPLEIVEIPIGIMDCGLIKDSGDIEGSLKMGKEMVDRVKRAGGILVLDWHQRTMYDADFPGWAEICFELVDYARKEGAFPTTMEDVAGLLNSRMAGRR